VCAYVARDIAPFSGFFRLELTPFPRLQTLSLNSLSKRIPSSQHCMTKFWPPFWCDTCICNRGEFKIRILRFLQRSLVMPSIDRCARHVICVCLVLILCPAAAHSTLVEYRSPRQLGDQSKLVARGRVQSVESYWNDKHTKVFTRTRIAVDETYKGSPRSAIEVIQLGGVVGNLRVTVHGAPHWEVGEEVLLFAEPYDAGDFRVSGFSQGKFRIERDPKTGTPYIQAPPIEGMSILRAPPDGGVRAPSRRGVPLEDFVNHALGGPLTPGVPK
jgi:hypothetical protein